MTPSLPRHIYLRIEHNPHRVMYETAEDWLAANDSRDFAEVSPEERATMIATGEVWVVEWYPDTPVGSCAVAASTLERALEIASAP